MTTHWCASWAQCIDFASNSSRIILLAEKVQSSSKHSGDELDLLWLLVYFAVRTPCNFCLTRQTKQVALYHSSETAAKTDLICSITCIVDYFWAFRVFGEEKDEQNKHTSRFQLLIFYVTYKENHFSSHFSESFQFLLYNNGQRNMICVKLNLWPKDRMSLFYYLCESQYFFSKVGILFPRFL